VHKAPVKKGHNLLVLSCAIRPQLSLQHWRLYDILSFKCLGWDGLLRHLFLPWDGLKNKVGMQRHGSKRTSLTWNQTWPRLWKRQVPDTRSSGNYMEVCSSLQRTRLHKKVSSLCQYTRTGGASLCARSGGSHHHAVLAWPMLCSMARSQVDNPGFFSYRSSALRAPQQSCALSGWGQESGHVALSGPEVQSFCFLTCHLAQRSLLLFLPLLLNY
jgi:hypothetical protein